MLSRPARSPAVSPPLSPRLKPQLSDAASRPREAAFGVFGTLRHARSGASECSVRLRPSITAGWEPFGRGHSPIGVDQKDIPLPQEVPND